nr:VOC family protein [Nocardia terpenica]
MPTISPEATTISFTCVTIDAAHPPTLADFYSRLLGWQIHHSDDDYAMIGEAGPPCASARSTGTPPPAGPTTPTIPNACTST